MTVGFFSPLPPARTGVADYASVLLRHLRRHGRVDIAPSTNVDVSLYHLGNNQLHASIYERALRTPGVVVLHDAVLHHFCLGAMTRDRYVEEFVYNYGEWTRGLADSMWRTRARSAADHRYFAYPMLRRICETSRAVIVHNPAAAQMVRAHAAARVVEIPHLFEPRPAASSAEIETIRRGLGVNRRTLLAGIFGYLRESKRVLPVLRAFRRLPGGRAVLLFAGDSGSSDLTRAMQPFLSDGHVRRLPYTPGPQFWRIAQATDLCINLRSPAAGETSGITIGFMGIGRPVMVTAGEEVSKFPEAACIRIDTGAGEEAAIEEMTRWLIAMPQHARDIGRLAAGHIAAHHAPDRVADLYWQTLETARS